MPYPIPDHALQMAETAANTADDRKGQKITVLAVGEVSVLADYFVIVSAQSRTQSRAIAEAIRAKIAETHHRHPQHLSGEGEANWIVLDYGEVMVHIMLPKERDYYDLEAFWGHAPRLNLASQIPT
ncbi:MAG: ribosome silencing factor [Oscillatoriales cyanobacterium SM2_2_1]|nr:ribosome silencing factor [Oscillatoriales cyanobacterium SM2_2_1]